MSPVVTLLTEFGLKNVYRLPIQDEGYIRTLWTRDAYGVPPRTNLYGAHPIFVNQKIGENPSASGVFFLNSNGMDVKFPNGGQEIEYNILGGVVDMFFLAGDTPADVARQGTQVWGVPAEVPYWSLGVSSSLSANEMIAESSSSTAVNTAISTSSTLPRRSTM